MKRKKNSTESDKELRKLLNKTSKLRLFCNTHEELGQYIGYNFQSNNGINNIPPFTAHCIFWELNRKTYEQLDWNFDLETILNWYETTSNFYNSYMKGKKIFHEKENIHVLLKYQYINDYRLPEEKAFLKKVTDNLPKWEPKTSILLLLMLNILPAYTSCQGDVKDIMADFRKLYAFLQEFIEADSTLCRLPVLDRLEKVVREQGHCNRAYLIYVAHMVLETYRSFCNTSDLYESNTELEKNKLIFDLDDCFWVEPETLSTPTVFWRFEQAATNDYFLYRYAINTAKKQTLYTCYEAVFYSTNQEVILFVRENTATFLQRKHLFKDNTFMFVCEPDDWETPRVITLQSKLDINRDFPVEKFIRLQDEKMTAQLQKCIDGETFRLINEHPESKYDLWIQSIAITSEYIYFRTEVFPEPDDPILYYRVPKTLNEGLSYITSNDNVGIAEHNNRKYLGFINLILYFDVTDEEACRENNIEIVDTIVI